MIAELEQGNTNTYVGLKDGSLLPPLPIADDELAMNEEKNLPTLSLAQQFNLAINTMDSL